jgi:hypothetical protein
MRRSLPDDRALVGGGPIVRRDVLSGLIHDYEHRAT